MKASTRVLTALTVVLAMFAATAGVASAGWLRGLSTLDIESNDEKVCEDIIEISSEWRYQENFISGPYPDFVPAIDAPYPGGDDSVDLYLTEIDAVNETNPKTVTVPLLQTVVAEPGTANRHYFNGLGTIPTPAGVENGDKIYVKTYLNEIVELTVGDPAYGCDPVDPVDPDPVRFESEFLFSSRDVQIPGPTVRVVIFDATNIDVDTLTVRANNGTEVEAILAAEIFGLGLALIDLGDAGVTCDTRRIIIEANDGDYYSRMRLFPQCEQPVQPQPVPPVPPTAPPVE